MVDDGEWMYAWNFVHPMRGGVERSERANARQEVPAASVMGRWRVGRRVSEHAAVQRATGQTGHGRASRQTPGPLTTALKGLLSRVATGLASPPVVSHFSQSARPEDLSAELVPCSVRAWRQGLRLPAARAVCLCVASSAHCAVTHSALVCLEDIRVAFMSCVGSHPNHTIVCSPLQSLYCSPKKGNEESTRPPPRAAAASRHDKEC